MTLCLRRLVNTARLDIGFTGSKRWSAQGCVFSLLQPITDLPQSAEVGYEGRCLIIFRFVCTLVIFRPSGLQSLEERRFKGPSQAVCASCTFPSSRGACHLSENPHCEPDQALIGGLTVSIRRTPTAQKQVSTTDSLRSQQARYSTGQQTSAAHSVQQTSAAQLSSADISSSAQHSPAAAAVGR